MKGGYCPLRGKYIKNILLTLAEFLCYKNFKNTANVYIHNICHNSAHNSNGLNYDPNYDLHSFQYLPSPGSGVVFGTIWCVDGYPPRNHQALGVGGVFGASWCFDGCPPRNHQAWGWSLVPLSVSTGTRSAVTRHGVGVELLLLPY